MLDLTYIDPCDLGFPDKFQAFRETQKEVMEWIANSSKRFLGASVATGGGKSGIAVGLIKSLGVRGAVLTGTKGLQDQYANDLGSCGLVDIRGKGNYPCGQLTNLSCRFGPHEGCKLVNRTGCTYETARDEARAAQIVVTNYSYWVRVHEGMGNGLSSTDEDFDGNGGGFDILVCDEGHRAMEELARCLQVQLREKWLLTAKLEYDKKAEEIGYWTKFAYANHPAVEKSLKYSRIALKREPTQPNRDRVYQLEELSEALQRICGMNSNSWVCEQRAGTNYGRVWDFDCVWSGQHAEKKLFLGIPKIVFLSATLRPASMTMLGIKKEEMDYREWPRVFPAKNTPIYHIPTVRVNHKITDEGLRKWVNHIDEIIRTRLDRKGIIHTVSYARQRYLLDNSKHGRYMVANTNEPDSIGAIETVERFKSRDAPAILVSPSFSTGWDFPGRQAEWQIITKVAFPETRSKVMQKRTEWNPRYPMYLAMQDLVQACGRGTRFDTDRCEVFIVDDNITWFMMQNKSLAPGWFSIIPCKSIPMPGKRVEEFRV